MVFTCLRILLQQKTSSVGKTAIAEIPYKLAPFNSAFTDLTLVLNAVGKINFPFVSYADVNRFFSEADREFADSIANYWYQYNIPVNSMALELELVPI